MAKAIFRTINNNKAPKKAPQAIVEPQAVPEPLDFLMPEPVIIKEIEYVPEIKYVDKIKEVIVEKIVEIEKLVEVPVEKIVNTIEYVQVEVPVIVEKEIVKISQETQMALDEQIKLTKALEQVVEKKNKDLQKLKYILIALVVVSIIGVIV